MTVWVGLAGFAGSWCGTMVGGVLIWKLYIKPRMQRATRLARHATRPPASQPTATTRGFVRHEQPVTVATVGFGRVKKATRL